MAIKKQVVVEVKSTGLDTLNTDVNKVEQSFKGVQKEAGGAGKSVEDVTKNGGAIAILDKLTGGLASSFRDTLEASRLFNISLKGMRTALIATGIGAFVVAVGLVVAYWDDISEFITGANKKLEEQNNILGINVGQLDRRIKYLQDQKKYNDENSISNDKLIDQEKILLSQKAKNLTNQIKYLEGEYLKEESLARQQTFWESLLNTAPKLTEEEAKASADRKTKLIDLKQELKDTVRLYDELGAVVIIAPAPPKPIADGKQDREKNINGVNELEVETTKQKAARELKEQIEASILVNDQNLIEAEAYRAFLQTMKEFDDEDLANKKKKAEEELSIEEAKRASRLETLDKILIIAGAETVLGKAALVGRQLLAGQELLIDLGLIKSKATKTLAEASLDGTKATSSVATGLSATLSLGFPAAIPALIGYAAAAAGIIGGVISATKKTKSVAAQFGAGGGAGGGATASIPSLPPQFNVVGTSGVNQLAQSINDKETPIVKAIVVASEVTNQQEADRQISDSATF